MACAWNVTEMKESRARKSADSIALSPTAHERRKAEDAHAILLLRRPADAANRLEQRLGFADEDHRPPARLQHAVPLANRLRVQRDDLVRVAELAAERRVADDSVDTCSRQRESPGVPAGDDRGRK